MTQKTRLIILAICALLFFIITPYLVLYSLGYRVDFKHIKIVATGGIYIKTFPQDPNITVDAKVLNKTGIFSTSFFVQNLLPALHTVSIQKDGYYGYQKNLLVKENEVTKLEQVVLFKQHPLFTLLKNPVDYAWITPNNTTLITATITPKNITFETLIITNQQKQSVTLPIANGNITDIVWSSDSKKALITINKTYFLLNISSENPSISSIPLPEGVKQLSFNPQDSTELFFIKNGTLTSTGQSLKNTPIKNVLAYTIIGNNIIWLSNNGSLSLITLSPNTTGPSTTVLINHNLSIKKDASYQIISGSNTNTSTIFIKENTALLFANQTTSSFENVQNQITSIIPSPDGQKIAYCADHQIAYSFLHPEDLQTIENSGQIIADNQGKILIKQSPENITQCVWLGNNYIMFNTNNTLYISEIDTRGNINTISLPQTISLINGTSSNLLNPKVYINQQDKKLYILDQKNLFVSEKIIP